MVISSISFGGIQSFAATALRELYEVPLTYATACITAYMLGSAGGIVAGGFLAARFQQHDKVIAIAFAGILVIILLKQRVFARKITAPSCPRCFYNVTGWPDRWPCRGHETVRRPAHDVRPRGVPDRRPLGPLPLQLQLRSRRS